MHETITPRHSITVFGSSQPQPGSDAYEQARLLGRLLAEAGFAVVNGGYYGTMQGVSQGTAEAGGQATGVTCALFDGARPGGNRYLTDEVHTPDLLARLRQLLDLSDGYLILSGGVGTLLELLLVWNLLVIGTLDKPCILIGAHWQRVLAGLEKETEVRPEHVAQLTVVDTPAAAVQALRQAIP